jgi:hypothetical protein
LLILTNGKNGQKGFFLFSQKKVLRNDNNKITVNLLSLIVNNRPETNKNMLKCLTLVQNKLECLPQGVSFGLV